MKKQAQSLHDHISLEAFLLSEQAGHPTGMDKTFWEQAEAIVQGRAAVVAGAGKAVKTNAKAADTTKPTRKSASTPSQPKAAPEKISAKAKTKPASKRAK